MDAEQIGAISGGLVAVIGALTALFVQLHRIHRLVNSRLSDVLAELAQQRQIVHELRDANAKLEGRPSKEKSETRPAIAARVRKGRT